ncbi:MAG: ribosome biogenesis GTPase Der [Phycisphaerales bacterium]|nr:MAG: ribosome biogenesis GTPase Der [Phycisphaerales bacterium]
MALPVVAIVGRPNVGKSSLLNCIARRMISIVEPTAGVTRDRVSHVCEVDDVYFELVDTGGYGADDRDDLGKQIERQIQYAVDQAAWILFVVDVRDGVVPLDEEVARMVRRQRDRVTLVVNKVDQPHFLPDAAEFSRLGFGEPIPVSATQNYNRRELIEHILDRIRDVAGDAPGDPVMKITLVGRRNTGKSTFINALAREERVIVSEVPGTTRDAIDVRFDMAGRTFLAIDTAGVRKKSKLADAVEFYGYSRAMWSVRRADVVLLFIDAAVPVGQVDKKLAQMIVSEHKPCMIVVNKWDLAVGQAGTEAYGAYLGRTLPGLDYAPVAFTTAKDGRNLQTVVDTGAALFKQARQRVGTGELNQVLTRALSARAPSSKHGAKPVRIYFATQVAVQPPTIVCFVNDPSLVRREYQRYLQNRMREHLPFAEVPIRLVFRGRRGRTCGSAANERRGP